MTIKLENLKKIVKYELTVIVFLAIWLVQIPLITSSYPLDYAYMDNCRKTQSCPKKTIA